MSVYRSTKLFGELREQMPKPDKSAKRKIKKLLYTLFKENWQCDAFEGIKVEGFETYIDKLEETHNLPVKAKQSFRDALISSGNCKSLDDFSLSENGEISMFHLECIVKNKGKTIDLAFAFCNLNVKIENDQTSSDARPFCMSDGTKNAFREYYRGELFKRVDEKYKAK